jgi:tetratricopeptide (TPR) repeat protein
MNYSEQALATLHGLKENPKDSATQRNAGTLYWNSIEENVFTHIREKKDIAEFLDTEYDCINFGISPEVLENAQAMSDRMRASNTPGRHLKILLVSDWIKETYLKIISGDRLDALKREQKIALQQIQRFEQEIKTAQQLRKDILATELGKKMPADICARNIDLLDRADDLYRQNIKIKRLSSRGVFIPVDEKRKNCKMQQEHATCVEQIGRFAGSIASPESSSTIKRCADQIEENIVKTLDTEEAIARIKDEMSEVSKKQQDLSPAEIEAAMRKEIDYIKDLTRLSAKRLHRECCCFMKPDDTCLAIKDISDSIDRVMEFDPEIVHNQRVMMFGLPSILIIPGNGSALYDWKNNRIIVLLATPGGNLMASIASGMIEYRLDVDEDKQLLTSYNKLPRNKDVKSVFHLKNELAKDYIVWMTSEYKGYKILPKEERKWFEQEIAPNKNDIAVPLAYRSFMLAGEAYTEKCKEIEALLAKGPDACAPEVLWTASILLYQQGKFNQAMEALLALIDKDQKRPMAYYNLGHTCEKLMRKQEAIKFFGEYCKRNPQSWWAVAATEHIRRIQTGHAT